MSNIYCPDCKRRIVDIAESCRCGWTKGNVAAGHYVHCAQEECGISAVCRVKTPTGFANFCLEHYDEYFAKQAAIYCGSRGLDTTEKQYKFCREKINGLRERIAA